MTKLQLLSEKKQENLSNLLEEDSLNFKNEENLFEKKRNGLILEMLHRNYNLHNQKILIREELSHDFIKFLEDKKALLIRKKKEKLLKFKIEEDNFDMLLGFDFIADIPPQWRRLALTEFASLLKKDGIAFFSTSLDLSTERPFSHFSSLIETEFTIEKQILSYDGLFIKLRTFFKLPLYFAKGAKEPDWRKKKIAKLRGIKKILFTFQTSYFPGLLWKFLDAYYQKIFNKLNESEKLYSILSKIGEALFINSSLAHVVLIARKKKAGDVS